jgi:NAD-dependent oxidoreductase involved in siderophore biosynthesis
MAYGVEVRVVEQLEAVRRRGRRRLLNRRYAHVAAVERVLGFPEGRVRAIALGFIDPGTAVWKVGDAADDAFVRELRGLGLSREVTDVLTSVYLEQLARERPSGT